jgi:hypothetical protein
MTQSNFSQAAALKRSLWAATLCASFVSTSAFAQATGDAGIEGVVTDSSGNLLANAVVELRTYTDQSGAFLVASVRADANGFYILEVNTGTSNFGIDLVATCNTSKGTVSATQRMYSTIREEVYRRDFRLTLPRRARSCQ